MLAFRRLPCHPAGTNYILHFFGKAMARNNIFLRNGFIFLNEEGSRKGLEMGGFIGQAKFSEQPSPAGLL